MKPTLPVSAKGKVGSVHSLLVVDWNKVLVRNARWWYLKASTLACHNNLMEKFITLAANMKCSCGVTGYVPPEWVLCALSQDVPWLVAEIWLPFEYYLCSTLTLINAGELVWVSHSPGFILETYDYKCNLKCNLNEWVWNVPCKQAKKAGRGWPYDTLWH